MLCAIALLVAGSTPVESMSAYFPVVPGSSWVYQESNGTIEGQVEDKVLDPVEIGGETAYPITVNRQGKELDRAYYQVGASQVAIVAFEKKEPLTSPYPIIMNPDVKSHWEHKGDTMMLGAPADLRMTGSAKYGKEETFAGEKIQTLEVTLKATILEKFGTPIETTQVAVYGKGVGLLRMDATTKRKAGTQHSSRKLIAYRQKQN